MLLGRFQKTDSEAVTIGAVNPPTRWWPSAQRISHLGPAVWTEEEPVQPWLDSLSNSWHFGLYDPLCLCAFRQAGCIGEWTWELTSPLSRSWWIFDHEPLTCSEGIRFIMLHLICTTYRPPKLEGCPFIRFIRFTVKIQFKAISHEPR